MAFVDAEWIEPHLLEVPINVAGEDEIAVPRRFSPLEQQTKPTCGGVSRYSAGRWPWKPQAHRAFWRKAAGEAMSLRAMPFRIAALVPELRDKALTDERHYNECSCNCQTRCREIYQSGMAGFARAVENLLEYFLHFCLG